MMEFKLILLINKDKVFKVEQILSRTIRSIELTSIDEDAYLLKTSRKLDYMELIQLTHPLIQLFPSLCKKILIRTDDAPIDEHLKLLKRIPFYGIFLPPSIEIHPNYFEAFIFHDYTMIYTEEHSTYLFDDIEYEDDNFINFHKKQSDLLSLNTVNQIDLMEPFDFNSILRNTFDPDATKY